MECVCILCFAQHEAGRGRTAQLIGPPVPPGILIHISNFYFILISLAFVCLGQLTFSYYSFTSAKSVLLGQSIYIYIIERERGFTKRTLQVLH